MLGILSRRLVREAEKREMRRRMAMKAKMVRFDRSAEGMMGRVAKSEI